MKKLLRYLRPYTKECILGPLFKLLEATLELLVPLVMAAVIDHGIAAGDKPYILQRCLLLAGLGLAGLVFAVTAQYFAAKAATGFVTGCGRCCFPASSACPIPHWMRSTPPPSLPA